MDNYAIYVWTTYGITFAVFIINLGVVWWEKKSIKKILQ